MTTACQPLSSEGRSCKAAPAAAAQDLLRRVQPMAADQRYHLSTDALRSGGGYGCGSGIGMSLAGCSI